MTDFEREQKEKFEKLNKLLEDEYCLIHLDSGIDGVQLPPHLLKRYQVTLQISRFFRGGFELTADRISTELVFDNSYFLCIVPLDAVWGATSASGENTLWPESAPRQILAKILSESMKLENVSKAPVSANNEHPTEKPSLTSIPGKLKSPSKRKSSASKKKKAPQLKVIK